MLIFRKNINTLLLFLLIACIGCNQHDHTKTTQIVNTTATTSNQVSRIVFGIFCGECGSNCATMYAYNMKGNTNTLFVDSTDSYFEEHGNVICRTPVNDTCKFQLINNLVRQIPARFLTSTKPAERFGCPDCTDGCGIYFEMKQDTAVKKFYMEFSPPKSPEDIRNFAELVKTTLEGLSKK